MIRKILGIFSLAALLAMGFAGRANADGIDIDNFTFTSGGNTFVWQLPISSAPVPEPSTYLLMIVGSLGLLLAARRRG